MIQMSRLQLPTPSALSKRPYLYGSFLTEHAVVDRIIRRLELTFAAEESGDYD
jgi:hypothetical protein